MVDFLCGGHEANLANNRSTVRHLGTKAFCALPHIFDYFRQAYKTDRRKKIEDLGYTLAENLIAKFCLNLFTRANRGS